MSDILPVGKLEMKFLSSLLRNYTTKDERVVIGAEVGEDAAVLDFGDRYLVAKTDPITFATDEIGWYVVNVCVNDIVVHGARPLWMLNCILLPEGKSTPQLVEDIFRQIYEAGCQFDISVVGGHMEVTYDLDRPIVVGHLIGEVAREKLISTAGAQVGDTVLITKALGIEGTAVIAREREETLRQRGYTEDFILRARQFLHDPGISVYRDALVAAETGYVHAMTDATEGGLATALHEMAEAAGVGLMIEAEEVPILPETGEICAAFNIDPLGLIASGALIMTAPPDRVVELQNRMRQAGVPCGPIGTVTSAGEGCRLSRGGKVTDLPYFASDELTKVL